LTTLIWSHPARRDLYAIAAYYGRLDPSLPEIFLERIEEAPLVLLDFPGLGSPTRSADVRRWRVPKTPFLLLYAEVSKGIQIRRVIHDRSDWRADPFAP
jgi:plasmid stabilization system protein ParE